MKKLFSALALAMAMCTSVFAQRNEVYVLCDFPTVSSYSTNSPVKVNIDFDFVSIGAGYNRIVSISAVNPWNCMFGMNFQYGRMRGDCELVEGAAVEDAVFTRMQIPVSLMYAAELGTNVTLEPYAGLDVTYYFSGEDRYVLVGRRAIEKWFPGSRELNVGYHFGANLAISKIVLGFEYQHDLTTFDSSTTQGINVEQKWHSYNFKFGYRF